jgi:hypothetical protein
MRGSITRLPVMHQGAGTLRALFASSARGPSILPPQYSVRNPDSSRQTRVADRFYNIPSTNARAELRKPAKNYQKSADGIQLGQNIPSANQMPAARAAGLQICALMEMGGPARRCRREQYFIRQ